MSEITEGTRGRLRRLNMTLVLPPVLFGGAVSVALDAHSWWEAVVLGLGVAAGVVAFVAWAAGDLRRVAVPCLVVGAAVWPFGVLVADSTRAFFGIFVAGALVVPQLRRYRPAAAVALSLYVALVGATRLLTPHEDLSQALVAYVLLPAGLTATLTILMFSNQRFYKVVQDLEAARAREAEFAVMRERMRFASDLHDIQGHTLHVVKLKIALAQKLLHTDTAQVERELREVHALVGDTIAQTKELAHAQRRLNLSAELENAKNLFEAAGIRVHVERAAESESPAGELLGQVLRETTTNILRHAQATEVWITLAASGITIVNDGAGDDPLPELSGLSALRQRVTEDGGELTVERSQGRFLTSAAFPQLRAGAAS